MIILKNINYKSRFYKAITDDTRVIEAILDKSKGIESRSKILKALRDCTIDSILLVKNKQNAPHIERMLAQTMAAKVHIIESNKLNEILYPPQDNAQPTPNAPSSYGALSLHNAAFLPRIVGITGTNGKTTTAAMICSVLLEMGFSVGLLGTRGFFINGREMKPKGLTTPSVLEIYENLSIAIEQKCDFFIMEVSSHAIVQERIDGLTFDLKILTNITSDHLDYHKNLAEYRRVKNSFFLGSGTKLINADEPYAHCDDKEAIYYGITHNAHLKAKDYTLENGISAHIQWTKGQDIESSTLDMHLYGKHNLYNALAALAALKILTHKSLDSITKLLARFSGVSGRMEVVHTKPIVIVDFAHTYDGMYQIFESFKHQKIAVVFGAGGDRDKSKRPQMGLCAQNFAHKIYITSDNPRTESPQAIIADILSGIDTRNENAQIFTHINRKAAIHQALSELKDDEVLLILGKGDEDYQIIGDKKIHFDDREVVREYFTKQA
ncbi:UDP-N-acetylmuramoyl-L-alanyl-D-glutamate--2,6-diaminopimelate ligase [Helicobacter jaachi]|uniref:UDP-N-acetylmuramoyl-L-alanyl-D-glutamate--2,6-diaminopimelate ligase n=2 Tax=Helicobacter jaachi TaxID=1677920 RepID=A0A4U8TD07_9HELI|nr:UDP-N-acetylmuramoyl-L-alanyl-D-glutamate--2,6-diaminopimelate ligase [Helicobacter jaachi]TLD96527.1 UDP-N-acetylmuramoyl-L-alanyl-D-glutamate--2,6-diaminopimelate ligase [Helicobacter jaachi]